MRPQPKRRPREISEIELARGLAKIAAGEWRYAEAKPFARRVRASAGVAAPYLTERIKTGGERERERAAELLAQIEGPRATAPLWDILRDDSLSAPVRAAAGAVLDTLGETSALHAAAGLDYESIVPDAREAIFVRTAGDEGFRERFLYDLESDDAAGRRLVLLSLAEPQDERALPLILPLLSSPRVSAILSAIEALESLASPAAVGRLQESADGDPNVKVRRRARAAYGRIIMQSPTFRPKRSALHAAANSSRLPWEHVSVSLLDRYGDQAVTIARRRGDDYLKVVTVLTNQETGVKSCTGVDMMTRDELDEILAALETQGLASVEVEPAFAGALIAQARRRSVAKRRRLPVGLEIWCEVIAAPTQPEQPRMQGAVEEHGERLAETGALLATPEFRQWFFEPESVWAYVDEWQSGTMPQRSGSDGGRTLDALISLAASDIVDGDFAAMLERRLQRQSDILHRAGKQDLARLARAAADGLDPDRGLSPDEHPFIRAMVLSSFFNAGLRLPAAPRA